MAHTEVPSSEPITLESVKAQFDAWRAIRSRGHRIPKQLWKAVKNLSSQYDTKQMASELKISPQRLRAKIMAKANVFPKNPCPLKPTVKNEFVEVSLSSLPPLTSFEQAFSFPQGTLELIRPDGTILKASGLTHNGFDLNALVKNLCDQ